jgi:hypothetical protein
MGEVTACSDHYSDAAWLAHLVGFDTLASGGGGER